VVLENTDSKSLADLLLFGSRGYHWIDDTGLQAKRKDPGQK
jgi:hypothetical protein